ncbi:MAG: hypothetical protein HZA77_10450 [Candidatus Schekmanbacteria bacterium]|nr:hypothetical protein [Candidatus Schekmanbacteria bacterium]
MVNQKLISTMLFLITASAFLFTTSSGAGEITLAPIADGSVARQYTTYSIFTPGSVKFGEGNTVVSNDNITVHQQRGYSFNDVECEEGIIEFDITSLSELSPGSFNAELILTVDNSNWPAVQYPSTAYNELFVYDLKEENEDGVISNTDLVESSSWAYAGKIMRELTDATLVGTLFDFPDNSYSWVPFPGHPSTPGLASAGDQLTIDVTSSIEEDVLNIGTNNIAGFALLWESIRYCGYYCDTADSPLYSFTDTSEAGTYSGPILKITTDEPTSITLTSFAAEAKGRKAIIKWQTATEIDNLGFNILRSVAADGKYVKINNRLIKAKGSATKGASYKFKDKNIEAGKTYFYKLEDIDSNTGPNLTDAVKVEVAAKKGGRNPFFTW